MSIPQICLSCGNHISTAHAPDCCYGTPEYAHLGWHAANIMNNGLPKYPRYPYNPATDGDGTAHPIEYYHAGSIRRLLEYLEDEPESQSEPNCDLASESEKSARIRLSLVMSVLSKRADELRREAAGISLMESRAKRNFAADILDRIISELTE